MKKMVGISLKIFVLIAVQTIFSAEQETAFFHQNQEPPKDQRQEVLTRESDLTQALSSAIASNDVQKVESIMETLSQQQSAIDYNKLLEQHEKNYKDTPINTNEKVKHEKINNLLMHALKESHVQQTGHDSTFFWTTTACTLGIILFIILAINDQNFAANWLQAMRHNQYD